MVKTDTGGSAFPGEQRFDKDGLMLPQYVFHPSMTLLDYFAGQVLQALIIKDSIHYLPHGPDGHTMDDDVKKLYVPMAYSFAEAMIVEKRRLESEGDDEAT